MAFGIKVLDASGNQMLGSDDRITRVLGITSSTTAADSLTDSRFADGTPWSVVLGADYSAWGKTVTFSGTTMSWTASSFSGNIVYGIY